LLVEVLLAVVGRVLGAALPAADFLVGSSAGLGELLLKQLDILLQVGSAVCSLCHIVSVMLVEVLLVAAGRVPGAALPAAELLVGLSVGSGELLLKQLDILLLVGASSHLSG
jgi:hypothetical protein